MSHCCSGCSLAVKANADRRDHIPKQRHRATSSVAYDAPLRQRGSLVGVVHREGNRGLEARSHGLRAADSLAPPG
jgi:hypothetical protein